MEFRARNSLAQLYYKKNAESGVSIMVQDNFDPDPTPSELVKFSQGQTIAGIVIDPNAVPTGFSSMEEWIDSVELSDLSDGVLLSYSNADGGTIGVLINTELSSNRIINIMDEHGKAYDKVIVWSREKVDTIPAGWSINDLKTGAFISQITTKTNIDFIQSVSAETIDSTFAPLNGVVLGADEGTGPSPITYKITTNIENGSYSGDIGIEEGKCARVTLTANQGYVLPSSIKVVNASYEWDKSNGNVDLSNPIGDVVITCVCEQDEPAGDLTAFTVGDTITAIGIDPTAKTNEEIETYLSGVEISEPIMAVSFTAGGTTADSVFVGLHQDDEGHKLITVGVGNRACVWSPSNFDIEGVQVNRGWQYADDVSEEGQQMVYVPFTEPMTINTEPVTVANVESQFAFFNGIVVGKAN